MMRSLNKMNLVNLKDRHSCALLCMTCSGTCSWILKAPMRASQRKRKLANHFRCVLAADWNTVWREVFAGSGTVAGSSFAPSSINWFRDGATPFTQFCCQTQSYKHLSRTKRAERMSSRCVTPTQAVGSHPPCSTRAAKCSCTATHNFFLSSEDGFETFPLARPRPRMKSEATRVSCPEKWKTRRKSSWKNDPFCVAAAASCEFGVVSLSSLLQLSLSEAWLKIYVLAAESRPVTL